FGVPWVLLSQLMAEIIFVGSVSYERNSDPDRECWAAPPAGSPRNQLSGRLAHFWFCGRTARTNRPQQRSCLCRRLRRHALLGSSAKTVRRPAAKAAAQL
ncbi:MAG: hypothetical protein WBQ55_15745, partial [Xanthobacteraceae bacterium]